MFKHNKLSDIWFRKYGMPIYLAAVPLAVLVTPSEAHWTNQAMPFLRKIPVIDAISGETEFYARTAAWIIASVFFYPFIHFSIRARLYSRKTTRKENMKFIVSLVALDGLLLAILAVDHFPSETGGMGGRLLRSLTHDLYGLLLIGTSLSFVYAIGTAMAICYVFNVINLGKEN